MFSLEEWMLSAGLIPKVSHGMYAFVLIYEAEKG